MGGNISKCKGNLEWVGIAVRKNVNMKSNTWQGYLFCLYNQVKTKKYTKS